MVYNINTSILNIINNNFLSSNITSFTFHNNTGLSFSFLHNNHISHFQNRIIPSSLFIINTQQVITPSVVGLLSSSSILQSLHHQYLLSRHINTFLLHRNNTSSILVSQ